MTKTLVLFTLLCFNLRLEQMQDRVGVCDFIKMEVVDFRSHPLTPLGNGGENILLPWTSCHKQYLSRGKLIFTLLKLILIGSKWEFRRTARELSRRMTRTRKWGCVITVCVGLSVCVCLSAHPDVCNWCQSVLVLMDSTDKRAVERFAWAFSKKNNWHTAQLQTFTTSCDPPPVALKVCISWRGKAICVRSWELSHIQWSERSCNRPN